MIFLSMKIERKLSGEAEVRFQYMIVVSVTVAEILCVNEKIVVAQKLRG